MLKRTEPIESRVEALERELASETARRKAAEASASAWRACVLRGTAPPPVEAPMAAAAPLTSVEKMESVFWRSRLRREAGR